MAHTACRGGITVKGQRTRAPRPARMKRTVAARTREMKRTVAAKTREMKRTAVVRTMETKGAKARTEERKRRKKKT